MTKSELRRARKQAKKEGKKLTGDLAVHQERSTADPMEFSETSKGYRARERWARRYDELNGAPEGWWDC